MPGDAAFQNWGEQIFSQQKLKESVPTNYTLEEVLGAIFQTEDKDVN